MILQTRNARHQDSSSLHLQRREGLKRRKTLYRFDTKGSSRLQWMMRHNVSNQLSMMSHVYPRTCEQEEKMNVQASPLLLQRMRLTRKTKTSLRLRVGTTKTPRYRIAKLRAPSTRRNLLPSRCCSISNMRRDKQIHIKFEKGIHYAHIETNMK